VHFFHVFWHLLIVAYAGGSLATWAITHAVDGYREERGSSSYRDGWDRFFTCLFWPLVLFVHRVVNVLEIFSWFYDKLVEGLRATGAALVRKGKK